MCIDARASLATKQILMNNAQRPNQFLLMRLHDGLQRHSWLLNGMLMKRDIL